MKHSHDLSTLAWSLIGHTPEMWRFAHTKEIGIPAQPEIPAIPARVPGSVQSALRAAGLLPDWNVGLQARDCEWVENRHWIFEATLPAEWLRDGLRYRLCCAGLDGPGWVFLNGRLVGAFANAFVPHRFDLTPALLSTGNRLQIVFECPPRWLGQCGFTSRMTDWKPRFNYTWDWTSRLVQIGVWDAITLEAGDGAEIQSASCRTTGNSLHVTARGGRMRLTLKNGERVVRSAEFTDAVVWDNLPVERWWPNGHGSQPLYTVICELIDEADRHTWRVGFKTVEWRPCRDAPPAADPWICAVNDEPIFLQGVNWTPIRPNFADVRPEDYRQRLQTYRDLGCNVLRVWGGAFLEKECFYDLCDELGLLVWQEFPLSSSGLDNWPPETPQAIEDQAGIATSYIARRQHHAALLLWSGGNELQGNLAGGKTGIGKPVDVSHPLIQRFQQVVNERDPGRRFVATSPSGPRFMADAKDFGKGLHWDVHGPWQPETESYWAKDDALFRSELGAPGASPASIIRELAGERPVLPASLDNPLWRRVAWWLDWPEYLAVHGREPRDLEEFVAWSQRRQADALARAVRRCKERFPSCGGVILWMGHDSFPCTANTAILDFHGQLKPAAVAVGQIFRSGNQL